MKKILLIIFCVPLIFSSCEKEDDSPDSNSNNGNNPTVNTTTGYFTDDGNFYKTTDSGVNWTYQGYCEIGSDGVGLSF